MKVSALSLLSVAGVVSAQSGAWGQCGGENWSGDTTCIAGWTCVYSNAYYSQCLQVSSSGSSSSTMSTATSSSTSSSTRSTATTLVTTTSSTTTTSSAASATNSIFPSKSGLHFTINGEQAYFAGTNTYWLSFLTDNDDVDTVLDHIAASGLKILRVWGFNDVNSAPSSGTVYFQLLENGQATINTGADGLQRLDYVVAAAEARGISLIINFVNNWTDYGGMAAYIAAFDAGAAVTTWYTNSEIQAAYQAYIAAVVSRYINSPAIFAWELANEPRCDDCGETTTLYNWIKTTSAYIKSLDSQHMVAIGDEGMGLSTGSDGSYPYTTYEGSNFTENISIDTVDFGTFHLYPSSWSVSNDWGNDWISNHGLACAAAGKPCLLEEYGVTSDDCSVEGAWQATALASTGIAADSFWQWGDTISTGLTPNDGYTVYDPSSNFTCLVTDHVAAISAL